MKHGGGSITHCECFSSAEGFTLDTRNHLELHIHLSWLGHPAEDEEAAMGVKSKTNQPANQSINFRRLNQTNKQEVNQTNKQEVKETTDKQTGGKTLHQVLKTASQLAHITGFTLMIDKANKVCKAISELQTCVAV